MANEIYDKEVLKKFYDTVKDFTNKFDDWYLIDGIWHHAILTQHHFYFDGVEL